MLFSYRSGYSKIKFQSIDEKKVFATGFMIRGFFFVFTGQYLVFDSSDLSIETMELFCICVLHCF